MAMSLAAGTRLGRYEIRSQLGKGGMGEVYLAWDSQLERTIALKVLAVDLASDQQRTSRFIQEAKAASANNHPNIAHIYEVGEDNGISFIAMEYVDGETLRQHMTRGRMKLFEVLEVSIQVASALTAAHQTGIIHRDIKPENIMVRRDGYVKVLDFGLAKFTEQTATPGAAHAEALTLIATNPGVVMGTANYMSPEQARGLQVDQRTDIWSLGVMLYEMVAGHVPFEGETPSDVIASLLKTEPSSLSDQNQELPTQLEGIVRKALTKDCDERYQTAQDLLVALKSLLRELEFVRQMERPLAPHTSRDEPAETSSTERHHGLRISVQSEHVAADVGANHASSAEYLVSQIKHYQRHVPIVLSAVVVAVAVASYFYYARSGEAVDSIAVLPFNNASSDANMEYLSDGMTETLINNLTQVPRLRVMARSTVFRYKGKEIDPQRVGRDLGVQAVMMGRVVQRGDTLTIEVDLVKVADGSQLWGAQYNRKTSDLLKVQQDISHEITEKLLLRLSGEEQKQMARRDPANVEAYQFYLKGRFYWNKRTAEGLKKAIDQFQQAIDKDPNYALAYVGVADCYLLLEEYAGTPNNETVSKSGEAVLHALQIDDSLGEAHASLALNYDHSWEWKKAEVEFKRAIELNPNYATTHHWYSLHLAMTGRLEDSLAEIKRAQQLDPLSSVINSNVAGRYMENGDLDASIEQSKKVIELDPDFPIAHQWLGWAYQKEGHYTEAIAEFRKGVELPERQSLLVSALGEAYGRAGQRAEALMILKELEDKYGKGEATAANVAAVYAGLGEKDQAFLWLEKDFQARSGMLPRITYFPSFDPLRSDPRYIDLIKRIGLTL